MIISWICQYVNIWYLPYPNTKADHQIAIIFYEILSGILKKKKAPDLIIDCGRNTDLILKHEWYNSIKSLSVMLL